MTGAPFYAEARDALLSMDHTKREPIGVE